jgi:hypothetical protein
MNYFLQHLQWWHWMVLAVLLAAAETFLPGAVAIWFAAAAAVIGLLLVVIPIPWQWQLIGFGVLGIVALMAFRSYRKTHPQADEQPNLNVAWPAVRPAASWYSSRRSSRARARPGSGDGSVEGFRAELPVWRARARDRVRRPSFSR